MKYIFFLVVIGMIFIAISCKEVSTSCNQVRVDTIRIDSDFLALSDSLILWLPCNNSLADSSKNRFTAIGRSISYTTNRKNLPESALATNGTTSSYVSIDHDDRMNISDTSNFAINLWFRYSDIQPEFAGIIGKARTETQGKFLGWHVCVTNGSQLTMQFGSEQQGLLTMRSSKTLNDNQWHMLTINVDRKWKTIYWYIDGQPDILQSNNLVSNTILNSSPIQLGIERNIVRPFKGSIDDVRMYRRQLTLQEISKLFTE